MGTTPRPQMLRYFAIVLIVLVSTAFLERNFYEVADLRGTYQEENLIPEDYDDSDSTRGKRSSFYRSGATFAFQVSDTLDSLLVKQGYNKQMRPETRPGQPVEVSLNLAIRNIGPIDEL